MSGVVPFASPVAGESALEASATRRTLHHFRIIIFLSLKSPAQATCVFALAFRTLLKERNWKTEMLLAPYGDQFKEMVDTVRKVTYRSSIFSSFFISTCRPGLPSTPTSIHHHMASPTREVTEDLPLAPLAPARTVFY